MKRKMHLLHILQDDGCNKHVQKQALDNYCYITS